MMLDKDDKRYGYKEGGPGIEALRKEAPEVVERMGYNEGGEFLELYSMLSKDELKEINDQIAEERVEKDRLVEKRVSLLEKLVEQLRLRAEWQRFLKMWLRPCGTVPTFC